jgi:hypothetical protein
MAELGPDGLIVLMIVGTFYSLALVSAVVLLTMARQFRGWQTDHLALACTPAPLVMTPAVTRQPPQTIQTPRVIVLPSYLPLPVRESQPERVVVHIEPPDEPNREQRAVQRLVAYLKAEALRAEQSHAG